MMAPSRGLGQSHKISWPLSLIAILRAGLVIMIVGTVAPKIRGKPDPKYADAFISQLIVTQLDHSTTWFSDWLRGWLTVSVMSSSHNLSSLWEATFNHPSNPVISWHLREEGRSTFNRYTRKGKWIAINGQKPPLKAYNNHIIIIISHLYIM